MATLTIPTIPADEVEFVAIRAQGAGGQHVNKVSSAVQLRFDIGASSLPAPLRERLLALDDRRISKDGVVVIKSQRFRSQEKNRVDALRRLEALIALAAEEPVPRRPTRPSRAAVRRRLDGKARRSRLKSERARRED